MTVVIATYNSARFLPGLAEMLAGQVTPDGEKRLEVIAVDGGSADSSCDIARDFGFTVVNNPAGHAIAAKSIGLRNARSRLVCILDHDERFVRSDALSLRFAAFKKNPELRAMISAGYRFESNERAANMYASEFGDPVSMYTYKCPNNERFRLNTFKNKLQLVSEEDGIYIFRAGTERQPILCEMAAGSGVIDVDFFRENHPEVIAEENVFPHAYYLLNSNDYIGIIDGDSIHHSSAESWSDVRAKISWRVNNAVVANAVSESGFTGRFHSDLYSPTRHALRFCFYALSVVLPLRDSVALALTRRRIGYLHHFLMTYFVVWEAVRLRISAMTRGERSIPRYGE